jgi:hypothetical protein
VPSALPELPANPANVVTAPPDVIFRIVLLPLSATYTVPLLSTATPLGEKKRAALPLPSELPIADTPASVWKM